MKERVVVSCRVRLCLQCFKLLQSLPASQLVLGACKPNNGIDANQKACKTTLEFSAGVELGLDFAVVGSKAEANRQKN